MPETTWWKREIVDQIYPRSFQDTNGDGIGDLAGIAPRLAHLTWLGIDGIVNLSKAKLFARVMSDSKPLKVHALARAGIPHNASETR